MYKDLKTIGSLVHQILIDNNEARSSDSLLYFKVLEIYGARKGIDIHEMSIPRFFLTMTGEFPNYESVRRTRQKIQEKHPELKANETVKQFRAEAETEFYAYAKGEGE